MHNGSYVFTQLVKFLTKETFNWIVTKYQGDKYIKFFTCWDQLLVMMYDQLACIESFRELVNIIAAHSSKSYNLGFGKGEIKLSNLAKANTNRDYHIFEEFTYKLVAIVQRKRINIPFELNGRFYAFDSTTIDLCLRDFWWHFSEKQSPESRSILCSML